MEDLFRQLIQGGQQSTPENPSSDDPLAQLLQGFLGGQASLGQSAQASPEPDQGAMDFGGLLQGLLGGAGADQGAEGQGTQAGTGAAQGSPDLGGLLQSILGGAGGLSAGADQFAGGYGDPAPTGAAQGGPDLGGLLQGVLGGAGGLASGTDQAASSGAGGGLGDILGAIMGSGSPTMESDAFLAPIVTGLAEKLGLPPQIAQTVVAFVLGKLMGHRLQPGMEADMARTRSQAAGLPTASLDDVVQRMNSGQRVTKTAIRNTGLSKELAEHTGLDLATAEASLQEVLNALGTQLGAEQ